MHTVDGNNSAPLSMHACICMHACTYMHMYACMYMHACVCIHDMHAYSACTHYIYNGRKTFKNHPRSPRIGMTFCQNEEPDFTGPEARNGQKNKFLHQKSNLEKIEIGAELFPSTVRMHAFSENRHKTRQIASDRGQDFVRRTSRP